MTARQDKRAKRKDKTARRRWQTAVNASSVSPGCKAWLHDRAEHSDDTLKIVWGNQVNQGTRLRRCERTIRTYRREAEDAGLIQTYRSPAEHDPSTGRFFRRFSNAYAFRRPAPHPSRASGPGQGTSTSDLPAASCRSTPFGVQNPASRPGGSPPTSDLRRRGTPRTRPQPNRTPVPPLYQPDLTPPAPPDAAAVAAAEAARAHLRALTNRATSGGPAPTPAPTPTPSLRGRYRSPAEPQVRSKHQLAARIAAILDRTAAPAPA